MIQIVVKRDGRVVGFNEEKIKAAIRKAMLQTEKGEDESLIQKITDRIVMKGNERMKFRIWSKSSLWPAQERKSQKNILPIATSVVLHVALTLATYSLVSLKRRAMI